MRRFLIVTLALLAASPCLAASSESTELWPSVVPPEVATRIRLSNTDVNRLVCEESIKDVVYSKEKGIEVKISGRDAFIKFTALKRGDQLFYTEVPSEFHVVCGDEIYTLVGLPQRVPTQTIRLSSGRKKRIEKNLSLFAGLPLEKKILTLIKQAYAGDIPESYTIRPVGRQMDLFRDLWVTARQDIIVEGEGLVVREFLVSLKSGIEALRLSEQALLRKELTRSPLAVALDEPLLEPGGITRAFIVECRDENHAPAWVGKGGGHGF
ncbi:TraK domain-containing protein [Syntrophotalea acetylenica]|uniref:Conjugal transfer pilus assembly protein TraK n=1 Tax=Syntrophotalea acetylenica TaxID=29542 RepID=A0A1L3GDG1_SYNAC|nr:type-F conjugative transfer system secretin TraK [Syntrophotalea acetylenica]APG23991.1 hypothetical protein A7E75_02360 [Syntrophotalea acetylenica]APG44574.1 hypothetical protein A6070_10980 [Syntrophotalea acetylenica]MDY0227720.1 type-F conjugative transfer system secretin TraK [Desulfomicrobium apsheronum]